MNVSHTALTTVAAAALLALSSTASLAATEQEITDALTALLKMSDAATEVTLGTPAVSGDDYIYSNVVIAESNPDAAASKGKIEVRTLTLTKPDVVEGALTADELVAANVKLTQTQDPTIVTVASVEFTNLRAHPTTAAAPAKTPHFDTAAVTDVVGTSGDTTLFSVASVALEAGNYMGDIPRAVGLDVQGASASTSVLGEAAPSLTELGYDKIEVNITAAGTWDPDGAVLSVDELTLESVDMGSLSASLVLGGATAALVDRLNGATPDHTVANDLTLETASLTYEDASLAGRILDQQAKAVGQDRAAFAEQISAALPLMLSMIGNPGFQEKLANAASMFLKDPKNITISVEPAKPLPLARIMEIGQTAPNTLPDELAADVTANE